MNYRTKLALDRAIGKPLSVLLNMAALAVGFVLRRNHKIENLNNKKIVICKIVGMGSIIEFAPMLKSLKDKFPAVEIIFITSVSNKEVMEILSRYIDKPVFINDTSFAALIISTCKAILFLVKQRIDTFINLEVYAYYTTFLSLLSLSRNRFGYYRKSTAFRKGIDTHLFYFNTQKNIREVYEQPIKMLGIETINYDAKIDLNISKSDNINTEVFLNEHNISKFILINTNASDLMPERRWPETHWQIVIEHLLQQTEVTVLLSGSKSEFKKVEEKFGLLIQQHKERLFNISGIFSLAEFICCIRKATIVITNDSGPLHLAFAESKPVISLWGPTSPAHLSIKSSYNKELYKDVYCSPCLHHADSPPCKGNNFCMKNISPYEVIESFTILYKEIQESNEFINS
jgi:ADP-heptose:LPS heptosyltransferase